MSNPYKLSLSKFSTHNILVENIKGPGIVLDVGCNDGYIGSIADKSNVFYGLDYSEPSILEARKVYKDAIAYDLNLLKPLPWNIKFDVIVFGDVLEHLVDPLGALTFFSKNYLAPGGRIIISVPNIANWQVRFALLRGKFDYTETGILDRTHLRFFTFQTALELADQAGLTTKQVFSGATFFGPVIRIMPVFKGLLATSIIQVCEVK